MPTINLSNNNQQTNPPATLPATNQTNPPIVNQTPPSQPPMQNNQNNWNDPWASPWDNPNSNPNNNSNAKRLSPQERVTMIEAAYLEILGRKPDTRDINYYKYSTLSEEEVKKQLITGNEHKQLLLDGRDYKKLKDRALQAETRVKVLEGQIVDQVEEFKILTNLLKEKSRYIQELREKLNSTMNQHPFVNIPKDNNVLSVKNDTHFVAPQVTTSNENSNHFNDNKKVEKESFVERLIKSFSKLF